MRIIRELPQKKASWKLLKVTYPDGRVGFGTRESICQADLAPGANTAWLVEDYRRKGAALEIVPNIVFEAKLDPRGGYFVDTDTDHWYWANDNRAFALCAAAIKGQEGVRIENGLIVGLFTFANVAGKVNLVPWGRDTVDEPVAEVPADAQDVSSLVLALGDPAAKKKPGKAK